MSACNVSVNVEFNVVSGKDKLKKRADLFKADLLF
jgi:hypothetical protein